MPPEKQEDKARQEFEEALDLQQDPYDPGFDDDLTVDEDQKTPAGDVEEKAADEKAKETSEKKAEAATEAQEEPEKKEAEAPEQGELELEAEEISEITLPDGSKMAVPRELATNEQFKKLVTQDHQVAHYQKLAEERQKQLDELSADRERKRQEAIDLLLQQQAQQAEQAQQTQQAQQIQRPTPEDVQNTFKPALSQLVAEGRISEVAAEEFGDVLSEYLYDYASTHQRISQLQEAMMQIATALPPPEMFQVFEKQRIQSEEAKLLAQVTKREGYEDLSNPQEWQKLKDFVATKIADSPKDQEGNPTFNPVFDTDTICALYDAMMAPTWRAALRKQRTQAEEDSKTATKRAAGDSASKASAKPKPPESPMTPELDAMTFTDPRTATG